MTTRIFMITLLMLDAIAVFRARHDIRGMEYSHGQFAARPDPASERQQELDNLRHNIVSCQEPPRLQRSTVGTPGFTPARNVRQPRNVHELAQEQMQQHELGLSSMISRTPRYELACIAPDWTESSGHSTNQLHPTSPTPWR